MAGDIGWPWQTAGQELLLLLLCKTVAADG